MSLDTPTIRTATAADLTALHALVESAYRGDAARAGWTHEADLLDGQRTDLATLAAAIAAPGERILVAGDAERLAGCVQISDRGDGTVYLGMLSVEPARQARGLGKQLLSAAESVAAAGRATAIEMTVIDRRAELIAYYLRRGYVPTGETRPFDHPGAIGGAELRFAVLRKTLRE